MFARLLPTITALIEKVDGLLRVRVSAAVEGRFLLAVERLGHLAELQVGDRRRGLGILA